MKERDPAQPPSNEGVPASEAERVEPGAFPESIGSYRILRELGQGGMGVVYLAEQTEPVRRRVALKMLQAGRLQQRELQIRFESERQAMARLRHPNVAQLFEAGATDDRRPYFVMELVEGWPITDYCDRTRLQIHERIELFRKVCDGVQHAHEKGLIHRDLKPANILVTEENDQPVPKVLDFGIAKALDEPLVEGTLVTGDRLIGTPEYLSPEAVESLGSGFHLDTRSDVYSLGVLLYELLVGVRPFNAQGLPVYWLIRQIAELEPSGLSAKWTRLEAETKTRLAEARRLDASSLPRRLQGDLDWIVLKALAKDPQDRYSSAADLAADLGRHLRDEPVEASPPSTLYRLSKFIRRRRGLVVATLSVFVSLVLGLTGTWLNLERARLGEAQAQQRAEELQAEKEATQRALAETEEIARFLQGLFEVSDPGEARGNSITARELLDRGAEQIRTEFDDRPTVRARFMQIIGKVFFELGLFDQARPLLEESLAIREKELGPDHQDVASSLTSLGWLDSTQGRYEEAEPLLLRSLEIWEAGPEPNYPDFAEVLSRLGNLYVRQGRYDEAEPLFQRSLEIRERELDPDHPDLAMSLRDLGSLYWSRGQYDQAEPFFQRSLEINETALGPNHPEVASNLNSLAVLYLSQGRTDEAKPLYERSLEIKERVLGPNHVAVARSFNNLGNLYKNQGKYAEAEPLFRRSVDIWQEVFGPDHPNFATSLLNLGEVQWKTGRWEEAEENVGRALAILEAKLEPDHPMIAFALAGLGGVYRDQGRYEKAEPLYQSALEILEARYPSGHAEVRVALSDYARLLRATGRVQEAEALEEKARSGEDAAQP